MRPSLFFARPTPPRRTTLARFTLAAALGVGGCSLVSSPSLDSLRDGGGGGGGGACLTCDDVNAECGEFDDFCGGRLACGCRGAGQLCSAGACAACSALGLSAGGGHSCLLRSDGTVWCWGANDAGQLGDGTRGGEACEGGVACRTAPARVAGLDDVVEVQAGGRHTCARRADGGVWCWGANDAGQLGEGAGSEGSATPTRVGSLVAASALSAGDAHTCAVAGGGVYCWGANASGELGDGSTRASPRPRGPLLGYEGVSAGRGFTCARLAGGSAWCWGANGAGQLGAGARLEADASGAPVQVVTEAIVPVIARRVATGGAYACAVEGLGGGDEAFVSCWGDNARLQLGADAATASNAAALRLDGPPEAPGGPVVDVAAGRAYACVLAAAGEVSCWGDNELAQLAQPPGPPRRLRRKVEGVGPVRALRAGSDHACVLADDGAISCWGSNALGAVGAAPRGPTPRPVRVELPCP